MESESESNPIPTTLQITQHSPTALRYTVTNNPLPGTPFRKSLLFTEHILRLVLSIWSLAALLLVSHQQWSTWRGAIRDSPPSQHAIQQSDNGTITTIPASDTYPVPSNATLNIILSSLLHPLPSDLAPTIPLLTLLLCFTLTLANRTTTESLLVLHTLGLQTQRITTSFPAFVSLSHSLQGVLGFDFGLGALFASTSTRFLPTGVVLDVLVLEAFVGWEVRYFLGVVVGGEGAVVVVFERCLPRLDVVERVWRGCRRGLWMGKGGGRGG